MSLELKHVFASLPQMERGVAKVIGGDPKGNTFLYTNGKCVIIRNIENPSIADIYTEHAHTATVAKYSPSGYYIASGDASGKVRIWDTTQKEHILKYEYTPISGKVKDIAWTEDSKRMAVVGEGREKFGSVFLWDTGATVGDLHGHCKAVNSVDIKQSRPYRLALASDDTCGSFFKGPPFKFEFSLRVSWSPDSSQLISASGDKTVKLWDVGAGTAVTTFNLGADVSDQQLGCLWQKDHLLSISLSGYINYLDKNSPDRPIRTVKGHSKSIQCLTVHKKDGRPHIYSGSHDGHINILPLGNRVLLYRTRFTTGENDCFSGKGHTNQVSKMATDDANQLVTCSMDDTLRYTDLDKTEYSSSHVVKMDFQPKSVSTAPGGLSLAVCIGQVVLLKDKKKVFTLDGLDYEPEVGALHPGGAIAAVGGAEGGVRLYSIQGNTLKDEGQTLPTAGAVTGMAYSDDGAYLAVIDDRKVTMAFTVADNYSLKNEYHGHHAKPVTLAWSPDNQHFATGGMDMIVFIWNIDDSDRRIKLADAHRLHHVSGLAWVDEHTLVTTSHDACVKQWTIRY
ncbi:WD repeat-containing protein 1-A [Liparis tanakae]|uniref:WD repeat-containing protein 1-A n=1 Tax=Liparis tanakae TaxID=230148 RepID=A0A4Z2FU64_9TELE|nr:WD repeat-containing protein 1-A [Liparis tanakae]